MPVPFLDLKACHDPIRDELRNAIEAVIDANAFAGGPFVETFEREFATYCQTNHAIGVGSGTEALWLPLLALGIGAGDEVITSAATFMATAEAISFAGAKPVFADIDPSTYTIDPTRIEAAITSRTKAIIPVHLFGQCADMDPILEIAARRGIHVIEDAAQAHGAQYKGRPAGSLGIAAAFSFYPGKNLGALGEAGAVTTDDPKLDRLIRTLRDHGQARKYHHSHIGWNARMDGIQAAALSIKLKRLDAANDRRRAIAAKYQELLASQSALTLPAEAPYAKHVYHVFAIRVAQRDSLLASLQNAGIGCGIHYPIPVHLQDAYASLGYSEGALPKSEHSARQFLSLPMYPELHSRQIDEVAQTLQAQLAVSA